MIRLSLVSVGMVEETASVILVLRAPEQRRLLVMEVGLMEGRAIAIEAEEVKTPRPLTHELTHRVLEALRATLTQVVIHEFRDKTFYANLDLRTADGAEVLVDARPSDAIALAIRTGAPILATPEVLEMAGIDEDESLDDAELDATDDVDDDEEDGNILH
ncbi:MAG: bifunctional nuclease family protein [Bacillota bacterium]